MVNVLAQQRDLQIKAGRIKLVLTDCDGVLTDGGVYYSERGEEMKRFSIRDGMGVERLYKLAGVEVGIITGELSPSLQRRANKLQITEIHLGVKDKATLLQDILARRALAPEAVAYIGDDVNDIEVMQVVGFSACPSDAIHFVKGMVDYICPHRGGHGAFRDLAEFIIAAKAIRVETSTDQDVFLSEGGHHVEWH
jgi:3-deoxy-D-manno-octulosonate 8-phosphate phosphatase (KDO 8-P phosphatase)